RRRSSGRAPGRPGGRRSSRSARRCRPGRRTGRARSALGLAGRTGAGERSSDGGGAWRRAWTETYARRRPCTTRQAPERPVGIGATGGVGNPRWAPPHGVVVLRVNVSVLLYVPVRSGSLAAIDCLKVTGTDSLEVGADHFLIMPRPCNGVARANVPLTRRPGAVVLGSATL